MQKIPISKLRKIVLWRQGLLPSAGFAVGKKGVLEAIERLGYVQLDTIQVIIRAHHHTIWSRVQEYEPDDLHELLAKDRQIFEYWSHAAAVLPTRSFQYSLPNMMSYRKGKLHWGDIDPDVKKQVYQRIQEEGPLKISDFKESRSNPSNPWWGWKPAKAALEQLFMEGNLLVDRRDKFQKVYDIAEHIIPQINLVKVPTESEWAEHHILSTIQSYGLAMIKELSYLRKGTRNLLLSSLKKLEAEHKILNVSFEGDEGQSYYTLPDLLEEVDSLDAPEGLHILSPFDNLVIQRKRLQRLFGYEYQMEAYYPKDKRVYGYFCLPILWKDQFVGRVNAKADRKSGIFHVRHLHIESEPADLSGFIREFTVKLIDFSLFNGCSRIELHEVYPTKYHKALAANL